MELQQFITHLKNSHGESNISKILTDIYHLRVTTEVIGSNTYYNIFYTNNALSKFDINLPENTWLKQCVGSIFNSDHRIVAYTQPLSKEIIHNKGSTGEVNDIIIDEQTYYTPYIEGARLILWNCASPGETPVWTVSTSKVIDGNKASWFSDRSFAEHFWEAASQCNLNIEKLNPYICYTFILCHPENNVVVNYTTPSLVYINAFNVIELDVNDKIGGLLPIEGFNGKYIDAINCMSHEELIAFLETGTYGNLNCIPGAIVWNKNHRYKVFNNQYKYVRHLIACNNEKHFEQSYLELRNDPSKVIDIKKYFPHLTLVIKNLENKIFCLCTYLYKIYAEYFITKVKNTVSSPLKKVVFVFIRTLHDVYVKDKQKITMKVTMEKLKSFPAYRTKQLLNEYDILVEGGSSVETIVGLDEMEM